jgi:hypothetical protein
MLGRIENMLTDILNGSFSASDNQKFLNWIVDYCLSKMGDAAIPYLMDRTYDEFYDVEDSSAPAGGFYQEECEALHKHTNVYGRMLDIMLKEAADVKGLFEIPHFILLRHVWVNSNTANRTSGDSDDDQA